uniref:Uncharacterized protein n=1 Tax=Heterorhabditis bacteriophora TaxID=37862 RepID=A0A1I7WDV0_HETBA
MDISLQMMVTIVKLRIFNNNIMQLRSSQKLYVVTEKEKKAKENGGTSVELTEKIETWCGEDEKTTPEGVIYSSCLMPFIMCLLLKVNNI